MVVIRVFCRFWSGCGEFVWNVEFADRQVVWHWDFSVVLIFN